MLKKEKKPYYFLLGGYDAEMCSIKELLIKNDYEENEDFKDRHLSWGAKLSAYEKDFHPTRLNVGIELTKDILPPENYLEIDHHNENWQKESAIEQVAKLLQVGLTREEKLIAINDYSWIPGLENYGATKEEIERIRQKDRACQNVNDIDEALAEKSLNENHRIIGGVHLIFSLSSKFSPITDRFYWLHKGAPLLIYNDKELTYYGPFKNELSKKFQNLIKEDKAYSGGKENGFFGIPSGKFSSPQLHDLVFEILDFISTKLNK